MHLFYKFIKENSKVFGVAMALILVHIFLITKVKKDQKLYDEITQMKPLHYKIQSRLSLNLLEKCDFENNENLKSELGQFSAKNGLNYLINTNRVLKIDDLLFSQIFLVTNKLDNSEVNFSSFGYLVRDLKSQKCFGVI